MWDDIFPDLEAMGVLTRIDWLSLVTSVEAYARYRQAADVVPKDKPLTLGVMGKHSPMNRVIAENLATVKAMLIEFGCTTVPRSRMPIIRDKKMAKSMRDGKLRVTN